MITADEGLRGGKKVPLKANVDAARDAPGHHLRGDRAGGAAHRRAGSDAGPARPLGRAWSKASPPSNAGAGERRASAVHPLYVRIHRQAQGVLHTTGGYLVYVSYTHECVFDLREDDMYWCTADVGWVTGHSYVVYGPLAATAPPR